MSTTTHILWAQHKKKLLLQTCAQLGMRFSLCGFQQDKAGTGRNQAHAAI